MCYDGQKPDHRKEKDRVNLKDVRLIETVSIRSGGGSDRCVWSRENFFLFGGWANSIWLGVSHSSMLARQVSFVWGYRSQSRLFFVRFEGNSILPKTRFFPLKLDFFPWNSIFRQFWANSALQNIIWHKNFHGVTLFIAFLLTKFMGKGGKFTSFSTNLQDT